MAVYKVSYVITGSDDPGTILNQDKRPEPGDKVQLGSKYYEVLEVLQLVPPRGEFHYIHVTCRPVEAPKAKKQG